MGANITLGTNLVKNNLDQARNIFFSYACNHSLLSQGPHNEKYKRFEISLTQETIWRQEYISLWTRKLSVDDLTAVENLRRCRACEALAELILMAEYGDSYAQLRYADAIWELAHVGGIANELIAEARKAAFQLWEAVINDPVNLTKQHRAKLTPFWGLLSAKTAEELVITAAQNNLAAAKKYKETKNNPPHSVKKAHKMRAADIIVNFEHGAVGSIEEKQLNLEGLHSYNFLPFRSISHFSLGVELERAGVARVEVEYGDKTGQALVIGMESRRITLEMMREEA